MDEQIFANYRECLTRVNEKRVKSNLCQRFRLKKLQLVNQALAFRLRIAGALTEKGEYANLEPGEVCDMIADNNDFAQRTPKTFSCNCLRLNHTTLTISTGGCNNNFVRVNVAGMNGYVSFVYTIQRLCDRIEAACKGKVQIVSITDKTVNNVLVMNIDKHISMENLIDSKMDSLHEYDPHFFSGASFLTNSMKKVFTPSAKEDKEKNIAFNSGNVTFLGVPDLALFIKNLASRLEIYSSCESDPLSSNSMLRQRQRIHSREQWLRRSMFR